MDGAFCSNDIDAKGALCALDSLIADLSFMIDDYNTENVLKEIEKRVNEVKKMTYAEKYWGDCSNAVAYELNFVQMCYGCDNDCVSDFFSNTPCCNMTCNQIKDLEFPKGSFSKKDYFQLDYGFMGVSEKLKQDMVLFGVSEDNFRPVYTKKHDLLLGYQITPQITLSSIDEYNDTRAIFTCTQCGSEYFENMAYDGDYNIETGVDNRAYGGVGYPTYISHEIYENLPIISKTQEYGSVIISFELYDKLIKLYPKLECRPVFIGDVKENDEYKRVMKTSEIYRVLNHQNINNDITYFAEMVTVRKSQPEIKMTVYSVNNNDDIKIVFYENVDGEYKYISSEYFGEYDINEDFCTEVKLILDFDPIRVDRCDVVSGLIRPPYKGVAINSEITADIVEVTYKNERFLLWYAVINGGEESIEKIEYVKYCI